MKSTVKSKMIERLSWPKRNLKSRLNRVDMVGSGGMRLKIIIKDLLKT
jgi:hypothetical protein